jgi:hypothetical protein
MPALPCFYSNDSVLPSVEGMHMNDERPPSDAAGRSVRPPANDDAPAIEPWILRLLHRVYDETVRTPMSPGLKKLVERLSDKEGR